MKEVIVLVCLFAYSFGFFLNHKREQEWETFKVLHKKNYTSKEEESYRMGVYFSNKQAIQNHNRKFETGNVSYKLKINQFGDLLLDEFSSMVNGYNHQLQRRHNYEATYVPPLNKNLPASVNWRKKGAVTPIKDQQQCGSCWAFSATGALEGQMYIKTGKLVSLSEQNLVDCSKSFGNNGCNGGLMDLAFEYIKENGGVDTESSYPYNAKEGRCVFNKTNVGATDIGFTDIPKGDEEALQSALANIGPVAVGIDAGTMSFQFYSEGIYDEPYCSPDLLNHGVLVVGYGTKEGEDYWLVKNSWGLSWGMAGYIKMSRNRDNQCGIASSASFPNVS